MKYLNLTIFTIIFLVLFSNCIYTKMSHLEPDELAWIKNAEKYQKVKFVSDSGKRATMLILDSWEYNDKNPFHFDYSLNDTYEAHAGYKFEIIQHRIKLEGSVYLEISVDSDYPNFYIFFDNYHIKKYINDTLQTLKLNDKEYQDCIIFESKHGEFGLRKPANHDNVVKKFIICKEYGLIYYEFENGEKYFRK